MRKRARLAAIDPWLLGALILAAAVCFYGIEWGRVECWNRDQMAIRNLSGLRPGNYLKPPFHTYLNHILVLWPIHAVEWCATRFSAVKEQFEHARLLGSRLLVLALFLGTIALSYRFTLGSYGIFSARITALLLATSAGFIAYAHFLSVDSPLLFWMLAALCFAQRIVERGWLRDYLLTGLLAGLCAATKYNGLVMGITIPVPHLLSANVRNWRSAIFDRRLLFGMLAVPVGFLVGCIGAIREPRKFVSDFMYNYTVAPAYGGETGHGYGVFLKQFPEIFGWPGTILIALLSIGSLVRLVGFIRQRKQLAGVLLPASIVIFYYLKIGSFPRVPTRFVLPCAPFLLLLTAPALEWMKGKWRVAFCVIFAPIFFYNAICSAYVGKRFRDDPRMAAQSWMMKNLPRGAVIESSEGSPHWNKIPELELVETRADNPRWDKREGGRGLDLRIPMAHGRAELFGKIFAGNHWVTDTERHEGEEDETLFTRAALAQRNPALVAVYSSDADVANKAAHRYYADLLANETPPYRIAFDGVSPRDPAWLYPREIDFLLGRMTILTRTDQP